MERKPNVLIVEDNARNQKLFRLIVDNMNCESRLAGDGEEGLREIAALPPDLVLMDIQMPNMDGLAAIAKLQEQDETRGIPVIAITSFAMPGDRERFLEAGFVDYLSKPVDTEALQQAITRHLRAVDRVPEG